MLMPGSETKCAVMDNGLIEVTINPGDGRSLVTLYTPDQALRLADVLQRTVAMAKAQVVVVQGRMN